MIIEANVKRKPDDNVRQLPTAAKKAEQVELSWRTGYDAARAAKLAGKRTPKAPRGADRFSYWSGAIEGAAAGGRDPRDVIAEILEEHLVMDPRAVADAIVEHLRDAGFEIVPARRHRP